MLKCPLCNWVPKKRPGLSVEHQMQNHLGYHALSGEVPTSKGVTPVTTFVAIGPLAWGKSETSVDEAVRNMKRNIPKVYVKAGTHKFPVYRVDGEFLGVDGFGGVQYKGKIEQVGERIVVVRK
jgi:hypothetical protein